jgi:hypothetical protein
VKPLSFSFGEGQEDEAEKRITKNIIPLKKVAKR